MATSGAFTEKTPPRKLLRQLHVQFFCFRLQIQIWRWQKERKRWDGEQMEISAIKMGFLSTQEYGRTLCVPIEM